MNSPLIDWADVVLERMRSMPRDSAEYRTLFELICAVGERCPSVRAMHENDVQRREAKAR